jgi:hypothetical protein
VPVVGGQPRTEAGPPTAPPSNCAGTYANGDAEFVVVAGVDGRLSLAVDGANAPLSVGADGLTFDILDPSSGQRLPGRFQRHPVTGEINGIQITGRWARRRRSYAGAGSR